MFTSSPENVNRIESDEGFSVEIVGRSALCYRKSDREMRVESEALAIGASVDLVVYGSSVRQWAPPHEHEVINEAERALILDDIRRALESRGIRIDIER